MKQLKHIDCDPGFLKAKISLDELGKHCTMVIDELSILTGACWGPQTKTWTGFVKPLPGVDQKMLMNYHTLNRQQ